MSCCTDCGCCDWPNPIDTNAAEKCPCKQKHDDDGNLVDCCGD